jgi:tetratricopeptide (TPR) repeat protein
MIRLNWRLVWPYFACVIVMALRHPIKTWIAATLMVLAGLCLASAAVAAVPVTLKGEAGQDYERIIFTWPENKASTKVKLSAQIKNGVLLIHFDKAFSTSTKTLLSDLKNSIALARLDADERTLRIALRGKREVKTEQSYNVFAIDLTVPQSNATPPELVSEHEAKIRQLSEEEQLLAREKERANSASRKPRPAIPLNVRASETSEYTRIAFDWTKPVGHSLKTTGNVAELVFDRPAVPNLSVLNVQAPKGLINASSEVKNGKTLVKLGLSPGTRARMWQDGTRVLVDLFQPQKDTSPDRKTVAEAEPHADAAEKASPAVQAKPAVYVDPSPGDGTIAAKVSRIGTDLQVSFDFAAPVGSAAFRRAETIWIVFDDNARLNMTEVERGASQHIREFETFKSETFSGVRFSVPPSTQVEARVSEGGAQWVFAFGEKLDTTPRKLKITKEADGSGPGMLIAELPNVTRILSIKDPAIGDVLSVATALGPITGVQSQRNFVDVNALPSAHGLAFEINSDGVLFEQQDNKIIIRTDEGLSLTPSIRPTHLAKNNRALSSVPLPARTATPGFIDFEGWATPDPEKNFNANYDAQMRLVAAEETDPQARIGIARFLVANNLGAEALGMLALAQRLDPLLVQDAQFRAVRGAANVLMHRIKDARADFAAQTLNRDPSAALWRGYLAAQMEDWGVARREFDSGREAFYLFTPKWQVKFRNAYAQSALKLNDLGAAKRQLDEALSLESDTETRLNTRLLRAAFAEASGDRQAAIRHYEKVAEAGYEPLEAQALFQKTRLQVLTGEIKPTVATDILENLRYRWRGDNTELEEVLALGKMYSEMGDYGHALKAMNTAVLRFPDSPVTRRISADMHKIFNNLFLHGGADDMDPVQALALFYQFIDMVPIGAEGDRMLRLLADRLIDFDLLPQATELLQHQVDNRIRSSRARAQIAAKLALVYLMDRKPEKALIAIRTTRQVRLPKALNEQRRMIEARALVALGKTDHALELIDTDRTRESALLRADIAWQSKNWHEAAPLMLEVVRRYVPPMESFSDADANLLLRTAIALSLNKNRKELAQLRKDYATAMEQSKEKDTFEVVTRPNYLGDIPVKNLAPVLAQTQDLRAVLKRYQERFDVPSEPLANASGAL